MQEPAKHSTECFARLRTLASLGRTDRGSAFILPLKDFFKMQDIANFSLQWLYQLMLPSGMRKRVCHSTFTNTWNC